MPSMGTPGTEMLMGLLMPAYRTFIIVAETVAIGSMTVYSLAKSWRVTEPSPWDTSRYPLYVNLPAEPTVVVK